MSTSADTSARPALRDPFAGAAGASDYDAIAELFLGDGPARPVNAPTPQAESARRQSAANAFPPLEAIVLGHLPGAASPWASQYAAAVAERDGRPVGLIRLTDGETSFEIVGIISDGPMAASIADAVNIVRQTCGRVLLRTDQPLHAAQGIESAVILSGADEAAVVGAYRTIKQLATSAPHWRDVRFRAAIMGADSIGADRARQHLRQAVTTFLENSLEDAPGVQRLGPVARTTIYRAATSTSLDAVLAEIRRNPGDAPESQPTRPERVNPIKVAEQPRQAEAPQPRRASSLAARVAGLTLLESRCPYHAAVELAADAAGKLNLLMAGGIETVGQLLAAETWARDHGRILEKAEPALRRRETPCLHLFTDSPADVRGLFGSSIRVHVLAEAGSDGFVCLPLNH